MTPEAFIAKWRAVDLKERSASQSHFIDLCALLQERTPTDADPTGDWYCFERGATKTAGGDGWADVWKRGHFGWEYKGKRKDLGEALDQLKRYALALENPPLLVVSDMDRIRIHTNWTNAVSVMHEIRLDDLTDSQQRQKLKWVFSDPERLRPGLTRQRLTEQAASQFAELAKGLRAKGFSALRVAHFINRLVFCMFAEDVDLLPSKMFRRMLEASVMAPESFESLARDLFRAMQLGGRIGFEHVEWFNGGLFDTDEAIPLTASEIRQVLAAAQLDWAEIDPSIFGTLFERGLDPDKRSQLGAHYTDREKIMLLVGPVLAEPLEREWSAVRADIERLIGAAATAKAPAVRTRVRNEAKALAAKFLDRLRAVRVLDPACGSGNFLYLALLALKDLEHRASVDAEALGFQREFPQVGPHCVRGIEINPYAAELARVSVWIGEIQWMRRNGFDVSRSPVLKPLDNIECRDAVLSGDGREPDWPTVDVIIGNPPFVGGKLLRSNLGNTYVEALFAAYKGRVPAEADYVCYWFEKARELIADGRAKRAGLIATQGIRGGANRRVLDRVKETGDIFLAWSDLPWIIEGAEVHVSLIGFDAGTEPLRLRDGRPVVCINPDLSVGLDLTKVPRLSENLGIAFMGDSKGGPFNISASLAHEMLRQSNPDGRSNSDVVVPWINGLSVTRQPRELWIIDFGTSMTR